MKTGIYPGMSRADYNNIHAASISTLIEGERSMAHLNYARSHPQESTPAMEKGIGLHLAVFEPAVFEKTVLQYDGTKRGKEWESFKTLNENSLILKPDIYNSVIAMRDEIRAHPRAKELLDAKGTGEMAMIWNDPSTGILCKGLLDRFCQCWGYSIVLDLKTCQDARPDEFAKTICNYSYHVKSVWYLDGLAAISDISRRFIWLAIESEPPHGIALYEPDDDTLKEGRVIYRELLKSYKVAVESNIWPCYNPEVSEIRLPKWGFKRT